LHNLRNDFPLLQKRKVVYFDNACTTLKPKQVIDAVNAYYSEYSGCAGRSVHKISRETEAAFEGARKKIADFIGANEHETVFTRNTTEAINLVSKSLDFSKRKKVVLTNMEHHSALLPFQVLKTAGKIDLEFVTADEEGLVCAEGFEEKIDSKTRLVVVHHTTNTTGTTAPMAEIAKIAHDNGALVLVDGAQGVPHYPVNVKKLGVDFLGFSGHKMLGPTGIGGLYARKELLEEMPPFIVGGETVTHVSLESCVFEKPPHKFEGGIQHYAGAIGLAAAVDYLKKAGMHRIEEHEKKLAKKLIGGLLAVDGARVYGPGDPAKKCALVAFNVKKIDPREVALMLNEHGIAVRSGFFCAEPAMRHMNAPHGAARASLYLYNTEEEIDQFLSTLAKIAKLA